MIKVVAEREINAPADRLYRIVADYRQHHPHMLPPAISDLVVEEGGVGAGTVIRFSVTMGGRTTAFHSRVEEPEPGKVLAENDLDSDLITRFIVTSAVTGSIVRIESTWTPHGVQGLFERFFAPRMLGSVYQQELALLDTYAREHVDA